MPRRLGQHFLIRGALLERIARAACPQTEPLVIEIGPGKGALTERLLQRAGRVIAVEIDRALVDHLRGRFEREDRLTVLHANVLDVNLSTWGPAVITGNLPYYITSPILERFAAAAPVTRRGVFLVQQEVAERVGAAPGHREYGFLSVAMQLTAAVEVIATVPPAAFHPPPKVNSAVLRLTPHNLAERLGIKDREGFLRFVALCFRHKRKTLRNNLGDFFGKERIETLREAGLRAEQIPIEAFAQLYRLLYPVPSEA